LAAARLKATVALDPPPPRLGGLWISLQHSLWREEVFGPVMTLTTFASDEEAVDLANDSEYGLAAAVFSTDAARLAYFTDRLAAGAIWHNCSQPVPHQMPWGGVKRSGLGREMGPAALMPFLEPKAVTAADPRSPLGWYALQTLRRS
jgi:betaine-aldehyde dehydrogenase